MSISFILIAAFLLFVSLVLGYWGALAIVRYGGRFGLNDKPNDRSSHITETLKGGGIGILFSYLVLCLSLRISLFIWLPAFLVSLVSFWGDRNELSPRLRLFLQLLFSGLFLIGTDLSKFLVIDSNLPVFLHLPLRATILIIFLLYITGTANFYNFMDGIDGIAGMMGVVAFSFLAISSYISSGTSAYFVVLIGLSLACVGFLPLNFPRARVFMGDVGSILLGFTFACSSILISSSFIEFVCHSGFLLLFYSDEFLTMIGRIKDKESLTKAHRRHLYQVMVNEGNVAHWKVSLCYVFFQVIICLILLVTKLKGIFPVVVIVFSFGLFAIVNYSIKQKLIREPTV